MKNEIRVFCLDRKSEKFSKKIKDLSRRILEIIGEDRSVAEIFLLSGRKMAAINKEFRGKERSTNILSFPEPEKFPHPDEKGRKFLGEIYLDLSLSRDFKPRKNSRTELVPIDRLVCHGLLHLLGYAHNTADSRKKMEKKEEMVLQRLQAGSK